MKSTLRALTVLTFGALGSIGHAQERLQLTPAQALDLSAQLANDGRPNEAIPFLQALLERNPQDLNALLLLAQIGDQTNNHDLQVQAARRGYNASKRQRDSFVFARLVANGQAAQGNDTRAQIWLRRARQYAPNEAASEGVARDYQLLRQRNRWSTSLNFAITPTSNVNNGTANETTIVYIGGAPLEFDLEADAQPLSGLQFSGGINTRYRFHSSPTSAAFADFDLFARTYRLSNDAKEDAPDVKASDFSDASIGIGLTYRTLLHENLQPTQMGLRFGKTWYGGSPYSDSIDVNLSQPFDLGANDRLTFTLSSQVRNYDESDPWVRTRRFSTHWRHAFDNGASFGLSASVTDATSDDIRYDYNGADIGLSYTFGQAFAGILLSGSANFEQKNYDANINGSGARTDETIRLRLAAQLTQIEYFGFQPVLTMDARQTSSNIDFFDDRDALNFGFDLRSSF